MADIISGNGLTLQYNTDTLNRSPQGVDNVTIEEVNSFPTLTVQSTVNTFEVYDSQYNEVLLSDKNVEPLEIVVNYLADDPSHQFLDSMAESGETFQLIQQYKLDFDQSEITYSIINGTVSSAVLSGDMDAPVTMAYSFVPEEVVVSPMVMQALLPISQGDYGIGSNTDTVPQYAPVTPLGNSFIKIPAAQSGNPAGADMMGVGFIDSSTFSSIAMTKTGTLNLYTKNASTAWTRIYTAPQGDARYVQLTRTINTKPLTADIVLTPTDIGLGTVTNNAQLKIASNLSDVANVATARTSLGLGTMATQNATAVAITGGTAALSTLALTTALPITSGGTGGNTAALARTNLGLGTSATVATGTSGATVPLLSTANTWTLTQSMPGLNVGAASTAAVGIELGSLTTATTSYIDFQSSGTVSDYDVRIASTGGSSTAGSGTLTITAASVAIPSLSLTTALPITSGGTGSTTAAAARTALGLGTMTTQNATAVAITGGTATLSTLALTTALPITSGGTGGNTAALARTNLGLGTLATQNATAVAITGGTAALSTLALTTALPITSGGTGSSTASDARTTLDVYSKSEVDTNYVPTIRTINTKPLTADIVLTPTDIGAFPAAYSSLNNVDLNTLDGMTSAGVYYQTGDAGATLANNYPTLVAGNLVVTRGAWGGQQEYTTRTGLKYVRASTGTFIGDGPWSAWQKVVMADSANIFTANNTFNGTSLFTGVLTNSAANPLDISSVNPCIRFTETDSSNSTYLFVADAGGFRLNMDSTGGKGIFNYSRVNNTLNFDNGAMSTTGSFYAGGRIASMSTGEAFRLVSTSGQSSFIMAYTDDSGSVAARRWYVGNGGSDTTVVLYNSKTNNSIGVAQLGNVYIQARSDSTGTGTAYTTQFQSNGTIVGPLGSITQTASDTRLKSDIQPAKPGALARINAIGCVEFSWDCDQRRDRGFIAQQIADIDELYTYKPEEDSYLNYSITALMSDSFGAIQELTQQNEVLQSTCINQQSQIDQLTVLVQSLIDNK